MGGGRRGRTRRGVDISGWIVLDKPVGMGSRAAVTAVQSLLGARKCGHAGTLDPAAEGVLPIALGAATKAVRYVMEGIKTYDMTVRWGEQSNTDDCEGVIEHRSGERPSAAAIRQKLPEFTGEIMQRPPSFSAIHVGGERAYALARRGECVVLPVRPVYIESLALVEVLSAESARFSVRAGKGAYMRALARDLAIALGTFGRLESLRRCRVGFFDEKFAISLDNLAKKVHRETACSPHPQGGAQEQISRYEGGREDLLLRLGETLLSIESSLSELPSVLLDAEEEWKFRNGRRILFARQEERIAHIEPNRPIVAFSSLRSPRFLGIGKMQQGCLKAERLFAAGARAEC